MIAQIVFAALVVLAIGGVGFRLGYLEATDDQALSIDTMRARVDKANYDASLAAFRYSEWRDRHYIDMQDAITAVSRAARTAPDWSATRLPAGVRDAAASATARAHSGKPAPTVPRVRRPVS